MSSQKQRLEGKVAIVTGGARGIGEAAVKLFIENGATVVITDILDDLGVKVAAGIANDKCCYKHCDVTNEEQVKEAVEFTIEKYGKLDIVYSNAGIMGVASSIMDMDLSKFDTIIGVNVRGGLAMIKHASRAMVDKKIKGSIICTASVSGSLGGVGPHEYCVSKHAVIGLVKTAAMELGKHGRRVNCVSPYGVGTELACAPHNATPEMVEANSEVHGNLKGVILKAKHIAEAALFLASDESAYVSGHNLVVDGGFTVTYNRSATQK